MKKVILVAVLVMLLAVPVMAGNLTLKQGTVVSWSDGKLKNLSTVEVMKTKNQESWGKWNILWDGWSIDGGISYGTSDIDAVALMLGRNFGTLAKYLPIEMPLADKLVVTLYPAGIYMSDWQDSINVAGCSGGAFINFGLEF